MAAASDVGAPILNPKVGLDRLAGTSFNVSQDVSFTADSMRSIFKNDYPSYKYYGRAAEADRPMLAEVMTRDGNFFKNNSSETVKAFDYKYLPKQELKDVHRKLRSTNFKMDVDHSKVNAFETMHSMYYPPKINPDFNHGAPPSNIRESHIPQGDKEKEPQPWSDYRDKFRGHDTTEHKVEKAPSMHEGGPPTIKGDSRYTHFNTTHNDTFPGHLQDPLQPLPAPVGTNVPNGDPSKVVTKETTMQSSFLNVSNENDRPPYNKSNVSGMLGKTNFKQADGQGKYNDYQSTATASYKPTTAPIDRFKPGKHRNHSDFPEGDLDQARAGERVNMTSNRFYLGNPALGLHNTIISGANLRTRSNVWFGEPRMSRTFYDTTTDDTFRPTTVPYTYHRAKFYKDSNIPLNYYSKHEINHTSSWTDYRNPHQGKTVPNPIAIDNLRKSHILPPLSGPQKHSSTHQVTFTPKQADRYSYDPGRLQRSSVPIGTLTA